MADARLLSGFDIATSGDDQNDQLKVIFDPSGSAYTATISVLGNGSDGVYWWSDDAGADDFLNEIKDAINNATYSPAFSPDFDVQIEGVESLDSTKASGRLKFSEGSQNEFRFDWTVSDSLDPRVMGFAASLQSSGTKTSSSQVLWSDYVHRYGWYPQTFAADQGEYLFLDEYASEGSAGDIVSTLNREANDAPITFDLVQSALARIYRANQATPAGNAKLTTGDPNAAFERWVADLVTNGNPWRFYDDITDTSSFDGPYRFPGHWPGRRQPLVAPSRMAKKHPEYWTIHILGRDAV